MMKTNYSPITLGDEIKQFNAGAFALTEAVYPQAFALPRHAHGYATISCVLKGSCTEIVGHSAYECGPNSVILKPAGEVHSNQYGRAGAKCLLIAVKPQGREMIRMFSRILDYTVHVQRGTLSVLAMRVYREFRTMDSASALSIEGLVLEIMGEATRHGLEISSPTPPSWLREARELIEGHFTEPISLFNVAASVGVNPAYLSRMFRKHYRCTVGAYVRRLRLDYASEKIARCTDSLADIAIAAGFYDQSHFTHAFKLHTGVTPAEFLRACQNRQSGTKRTRSS
jgi:AraC family transcriptional regulator